MKVLVLGSQGQLGRCLADQFQGTNFEVFYANRKEIDLRDLNFSKDAIVDVNPDIIINAAAFTAVDKAEVDQEEAFLINDTAVAKLAYLCKANKIWLIHISTDYVFDGVSEEPYKETDKTNPQNIYGKSKLNGEIAIQNSGCKYLIIRTAWVFSEYGNNFVKTMLKLSKTHSEVRVVSDQFGCPTYAHDLARAIISTLSFLQPGLMSGIYHYTGTPRCSWAEFSRFIFDEADRLGLPSKSPKVKAITSLEYPTAAKRPLNSVLSTSLFESTFRYKSGEWSYGVSEVLSGELETRSL